MQTRVKGNIRSNSAEFVREALLSGLGVALRSTWDVEAELESGALEVVLPQYRGSSAVGIFAVYPCREFMPNKVNVFIEFLIEVYAANPPANKKFQAVAQKPSKNSKTKSTNSGPRKTKSNKSGTTDDVVASG